MSGALYEYTDGSAVKAYNAANSPEYRQFVAKVSQAMGVLRKEGIVAPTDQIVLHGTHGARMANTKHARVSAGPNAASTLPDDEIVSIEEAERRILKLLGDKPFRDGAIRFGDRGFVVPGGLHENDFETLMDNWQLIRDARLVIHETGDFEIIDLPETRISQILRRSNYSLLLSTHAFAEMKESEVCSMFQSDMPLTVMAWDQVPPSYVFSDIQSRTMQYLGHEQLQVVFCMTDTFIMKSNEAVIFGLIRTFKKQPSRRIVITLLEKPTRQNNDHLLPPSDPLWKKVVAEGALIANPYNRRPLPDAFKEQISSYSRTFNESVRRYFNRIVKVRHSALKVKHVMGVLDDDVAGVIAKAMAYKNIFMD